MANVNKNVKIRYKGEQNLTMTFNNLEVNDQTANFLQSLPGVIESQNETANIEAENKIEGE